MHTPKELTVDQAILDYTPTRLADADTWQVIQDHVRTAVHSQHLTKRDTVWHWMGDMTRYYAWCHHHGHPLELQPYLIDAFCEQLTLVPSSVQRYRRRLTRVGENLGTLTPPSRTHYTHKLHLGETPYTHEELDYWWRIAQSQKTTHRVRLLSSVIALGAGAGLTTSEIANLPKDAIQTHPSMDDLLLVHLPERVSVVDTDWAERVHDLNAQIPGEYWFGTMRMQTKDLLTYVKSKAIIPADAPTLTVRRLRTTYAVTLLNRGVLAPEFFAIFGSKSAITYERLARFVTPRWENGQYLRIAAGLR